MLAELQLCNFRGFDDHVIPFREVTIVVGRNNAGKTTIVEALRLISVVTSRYQALHFSDVPPWLEIPRYKRGIAPSLKGLEINLDSIFHRYRDPPAVIKGRFDTGEAIEIYIGPEGGIHAVLFNRKGAAVTTPGNARSLNLPRVSILPQIGPLAKEETILIPGYIRSNLSSALASIHFRNQLNLLSDLFSDFKGLAELSWPGLKIRELEGRGKLPGSSLNLFVQDRDFVAEVGRMGHGLQMWLQTMWFLTRAENDDTVILDEPDVYMHADLQRRLIRLLRGRHKQIVIATHSIEIMAEVQPENILVVDKGRERSTFTTSLPAVQRVVDHIGGVHNLQLARLWTSRRVLLLEGKDLSFMKAFQNTLYPHSDEPIDAIPSMTVGGWGGWNYAVGSSMLLRNSAGEDITTYCILDSDYHTPEEIKARLADARQRQVQLHVWGRKEIENYLLVPAAIHRAICSRLHTGAAQPSLEEVEVQLDEIAEAMKDEVFDAMAGEFLAQDRRAGINAANAQARARIGVSWGTRGGRLSIVSGKAVLSRLSGWSQATWNVSFSPAKVAQELLESEIAAEVRGVIDAVESKQPFP